MVFRVNRRVPASDRGEGRHAKVHGGLTALNGAINLGQLLLGCGKADAKSVGFAEPAFTFRFCDASG